MIYSFINFIDSILTKEDMKKFNGTACTMCHDPATLPEYNLKDIQTLLSVLKDSIK